MDQARTQSPRRPLSERPLELLAPRTLGELNGLACPQRRRVPMAPRRLPHDEGGEDPRVQLEIFSRLGEGLLEQRY